MNVFNIADLDETVDAEFDKLCSLCEGLFNGDQEWSDSIHPSSLRAHYDIDSMIQSSENGCHLCTLMVSQVLPENIALLQEDLAEGRVRPDEQISISIWEDTFSSVEGCWPLGTSSLILIARNDSIQHQIRLSQKDFVFIGRLGIRLAESDFTKQEPSLGVWNCSRSTIAQITQWTDQCTREHDRCSEIQAMAIVHNILPTRLLNVSTIPLDGCIRLVSTKSMSLDTKYITLSHCWGGQSTKMLTRATLSQFSKGITFSSLPKTFQDAAFVTNELGISYLWIDTLCIIQDFDSDDDWRHEAGIMGDIYANSYLTLAATNSPHSDGGLFYRRHPLTLWSCRITPTWNCFSTDPIVIYNRGWAQPENMKPLQNRAWAYQEWLLSKRLVHFGKDQIRWECYCLAASDVYPNGVDDPDNRFQIHSAKSPIVHLTAKHKNYLLQDIKMDYTRKQLTRHTDRLAAFSGIARMVNKVMGLPDSDFVAGLSRSTLLRDLLWERVAEDIELHDNSVYVAPSWSWASLDCRMWVGDNNYILDGAYAQKMEKASIWLAEVLDIKLLLPDDAFGPIHHASLKLGCAICRLGLSSPSLEGAISSCWTTIAINDVPFSHICKVKLDRMLDRTIPNAT